MKDEIKEILRYLRIENGHCSSELSYEETRLLLDYITKLQEEKDNYKNKFWEEQEQSEYLQDKIDKAIEYINHAQNYGTTEQVMPHLKLYINGKDLLNILKGE